MIAARAIGRAIARGAARAGRAIKRVVKPTEAQKAEAHQAKMAKLERTKQVREAKFAAAEPKYKLAKAKPSYEIKKAKAFGKASKSGGGGLGAGTGLIAGMTVSDLLNSLKGEGAGAGGTGAELAGGYPEAYQGIADTAVRAQALHDRTVMKLARLEARTRIKLAKIQRNRDLAVTYLSNPVIGVGVAYATVVGVISAVEFAKATTQSIPVYNAANNVSRAAVAPTLTMAGPNPLPQGVVPIQSNPWLEAGSLVSFGQPAQATGEMMIPWAQAYKTMTTPIAQGVNYLTQPLVGR